MKLWVLIAFLFLMQPEPLSYSTFLPVVLRPHQKIGLAWNETGKNDVSLFGFPTYHNWTIGWQAENDEQTQNTSGLLYIPYFWCEFRPEGTDLKEKLDELDGGLVLFLNEPNGDNPTNQCPRTSQQAALLYQEALMLCPACQFTLPVVSHLDYPAWHWLREYLGWLDVYKLPIPTYGAFNTYLPEIDEMIRTYPLPLSLVIPEFTNCDKELAAGMWQAIEREPRIMMAFYFSSVETGCGDLFYDTGTDALTEMGERLLGGIHENHQHFP